jgi:hypothetical protein
VKETLIKILDFLNEDDRICLIEFDDRSHRITPLVRVSKENI